ncbi:MAG TPA: hypothetical protein VF095_07310 [Bacillota bacterium]
MNHLVANTGESITESSKSFDGIGFSGGIVLVVLLFLLIFGSIDIEDLTNAP